MKHKLSLFILLVTLPTLIFALTKHDFAYIADIKTNNNTPFYELEIPAAIYKTISRADLGDLRVLNGDGQVVPHGLRNASVKINNKKESQNIPFYPLYQEIGNATTDLHLNIQRNSQGEVINIHSSIPKNKNNNHLSGYLLDLREWKKPVNQLIINWKKSENSSFIRKLKISKSANLERWRFVARGKTLVNMSFQNHQLMENSINISVAKTNYLRLVFEDQKPGLEIDSIQAVHSRSIQHKQQNWKTVSISKTNVAGEYSFLHDLKTYARQLDIKLPENNTVVKVQVLSRSNSEQAWRYRGSTLLYRLSVNGSDIEKTTLHISANRDTHWLLRVDQQGGGIGSGLPVVKLAWQPQQLVFVARGQAPYKIVWGSAQVKPVLMRASQLLPANALNKNENYISNANMLSSAELLSNTLRSINKQVLKPKEKEINWQHWILWLSLIVSAAMLIWMATRLMKKMADS